MDLLSIVRATWRHKFAAIPVILLTAAGVFYVMVVKPPVYEASSSILLLNAPTAPTAAQVAADPKLAKVNSSNPYVNLGNLSVVADAVLNVVTSDASAQSLVNAGADPQYQIILSNDFGSPPILQITGIGHSAQEAILTANLVAKTAEADLYKLQKEQGVNKFYMIKSVELVRPLQARLSVSGKLRTLIAVLGLGSILLLVVISITDVVAKRRTGGSINPAMPMGASRDDAERERARASRETVLAQDGRRRQSTPTADQARHATGPGRQRDPESPKGQTPRRMPFGDSDNMH